MVSTILGEKGKENSYHSQNENKYLSIGIVKLKFELGKG
jgi:hypothetical protein